MQKSKLARQKGQANPGYIQAMRELRRSSAATPHVPLSRKGSRLSRTHAAIRESRDQ